MKDNKLSFERPTGLTVKNTRLYVRPLLPAVGTVLRIAVTLALVWGVISLRAHTREASVSQATCITRLVKDVNATDGNSSSPWQLVEVNGTLFFVARDGIHGRELWKSDGTEAGTVMVKDILPSSPDSYLRYLTDVNGTLFFRAADPDHGWELWKSDGTQTGTVMVKDIRPGSADSLYRYMPYPAASVNDTFFFAADDGSRGTELWRSDGTATGTVMVKDVRSGSPAGLVDGTEMISLNGILFFVASDRYGAELWKSDGTEAGTVMVKDIHHAEQDSLPHHLTEVDGAVFFVADDGIHGRELWKSDGTEAGTIMVKDIRAGEGDSIRWEDALANLEGTLFFAANGGHGIELWKSNGTRAGTALVKDINPLATCNEEGHYPGSGSYPCNSYPSALTPVGSTLFFGATDGSHGWELWKSDGTEAGTVLVRDVWPGDQGSMYEHPLAMAGMNGRFFFAADDGIHDRELWQSDGTEVGTVLVQDINTWGSSRPSHLTPIDGTLFFQARDSVHGEELWAVSEACCSAYLPLLSRP